MGQFIDQVNSRVDQKVASNREEIFNGEIAAAYQSAKDRKVNVDAEIAEYEEHIAASQPEAAAESTPDEQPIG